MGKLSNKHTPVKVALTFAIALSAVGVAPSALAYNSPNLTAPDTSKPIVDRKIIPILSELEATIKHEEKRTVELEKAISLDSLAMKINTKEYNKLIDQRTDLRNIIKKHNTKVENQEKVVAKLKKQKKSTKKAKDKLSKLKKENAKYKKKHNSLEDSLKLLSADMKVLSKSHKDNNKKLVHNRVALLDLNDSLKFYHKLNPVITNKDVLGVLVPDKTNFKKFTEKHKSDREAPKTVKVDSWQDMTELLQNVYKTLPDTVIIDTHMALEDLERVETEFYKNTDPADIINVWTLASYTLEKKNGKIVLYDDSRKDYSAKETQLALKDFSNAFATSLKGLSDEEKFKVIYEFAFTNYTYKASSPEKMRIGNMAETTMACNGFSRLIYELSKDAGLSVELLRGDDHFWNRINLDNKGFFTVDVTTDIVLGVKHASTGLSRADHENLMKNTFYSTKYSDGKYADPIELSEVVKHSLTK